MKSLLAAFVPVAFASARRSVHFRSAKWFIYTRYNSTIFFVVLICLFVEWFAIIMYTKHCCGPVYVCLCVVWMYPLSVCHRSIWLMDQGFCHTFIFKNYLIFMSKCLFFRSIFPRKHNANCTDTTDSSVWASRQIRFFCFYDFCQDTICQMNQKHVFDHK